eukprot:TRINITY_DN80574_c0_g1_i1.p1 TRINITY_DN80574_c0_g1~~TRINITY_DN80574_c0_g1_i1.p1  ORF type:complete len:590 (-),score=74.93 TRINITY_DN80574_c0_g1_i1:74-1843(-)
MAEKSIQQRPECETPVSFPAPSRGDTTPEAVWLAREKLESMIPTCSDTSELLLAIDAVVGGCTRTGKDLDYCSRSLNLSPLEIAVSEQRADVVDLFLTKGKCSVDEIFGFNCTCLCKCCYSQDHNLTLIKKLLYHGADPNATISNDASSANCLITAVVKGNIEIVRLLLDYGADLAYEWKGQNALSLALDFRKSDIVELIEQYEYKRAQRNRMENIQRRLGTDDEGLTPETISTETAPAAAVMAAAAVAEAEAKSIPSDAPCVPDSGAVPHSPARAPEENVNSSSHRAPLAPNAKRTKPPSGQSTFYEEVAACDWVLRFSTDIELGEQLGSGGFGQVYRGVLKKSGDRVAIKRTLCQDAKMLSSFKQEVRLLSTFRHENIVLFRGACVELPNLCLVTELMDCNLYDYLHHTKNPIPWMLKLRWGRDLARGMNYLHSMENPIIHRDLKSPNVLLDEYRRVKLCDFGMSRVKEHTFLITQHIGGSPAWMAPECLRGEDFNEKSDGFSFGVILWEMLTRQIPWKSKNMPQLVGLVGFQNKQLEIPDPLPPNTAEDYVPLMVDCWAPSPAARPSFRQMVTRFEKMIERQPPEE